MSIVKGRGCTCYLLLHVTLNETEKVWSEFQEVGGYGVHWYEVEGEFRVKVRVVMGVNTCVCIRRNINGMYIYSGPNPLK